MARKRMIDPSIWMDEGMAELSPRQQLLYIGLFSNADDEGRLKGSPTVIRMMLPTVYGGCDLAEVEADLDAVLAVMQQLVRYEVDGRPYLVFQNYLTWQYIQKPQPSRLPPPPSAENEPAGTAPVAAPEESDTSTVPVPERHATAIAQKKRIEKKGMEGEENGPPPPVERVLTPRERATATLAEFGVSEKQIERTLSMFPDSEMPGIALEALGFVDHWQDKPPKSPDRAWLNWLKMKRKFEQRDQANAPPRPPTPHYYKPMPTYSNGGGR